MMDPRQVDRGPLTTINRVDRSVMTLQAADADFDFARLDHQRFASPDLAALHTTGHDRSVACDCKGPVDGHAKRTGSLPLLSGANDTTRGLR